MRENFEHLPDDASPRDGVLRSDFYIKYKKFFRDNGYSGLKLNDQMLLGKILTDMNVKTKSSNGKRYYMVKQLPEIDADEISEKI